jgi:spore germination protein YaaH
VSPSLQVSQSVKRELLKVRGSIPYWDETTAFASLRANKDIFDSVSLFWLYLTEEGNLAKYSPADKDTSMIDFAREEGIKVSMVVTNLPEEEAATWDSSLVEQIIRDSEIRKKHIEDLIYVVNEWGVDGVTIDFEEIVPETREDFSIFIKELSQAFHQKGLFVGVALHPKVGKKNDQLYDFQDWKALAQSADELYIMAYGEHYDEGRPGPIASKDWVESIIAYAKAQEVPLEKFYLGIPLYGYDWTVDSEIKASGLKYNQIRELMKRYNVNEEWGEDAPAPFFRYIDGDGWEHEVWFENAASVEDKIDIADKAGFGGVTFWRLGGEDPDVWERLARSKFLPSPTP